MLTIHGFLLSFLTGKLFSQLLNELPLLLTLFQHYMISSSSILGALPWIPCSIHHVYPHLQTTLVSSTKLTLPTISRYALYMIYHMPSLLHCKHPTKNSPFLFTSIVVKWPLHLSPPTIQTTFTTLPTSMQLQLVSNSSAAIFCLTEKIVESFLFNVCQC